ncbi:hypothetical protein KSX49_13970 [Phocaeicola dorei]|uniref:hypothetical protein n=1 Tax=Phocaeicola dorei TaxID=357276 RepID=UPI000B396D7F|nr:hypothetical protein [Phocaeicola dorei]RGP20986.1 hypothetical protein DW034_11100 [Bacteroides sp. AF39-10AT]MBT1287593.1 hypothetical protein [Phocaeicola dorei]MBT1291067.1 hypothetical protein [Phocaeicola dorei]MBV3582379.1 hypothetical protein [Phocaeicola dorei]MBV3606886.1 hypothetical protein [Phocaeicola dorei]
MEWGKKHLALPNLTLELTGKIEQYLAWLLEQSADRMGIAEERRIFNTAVNPLLIQIRLGNHQRE